MGKRKREEQLASLKKAKTLKDKIDLEMHNKRISDEREEWLKAGEVKNALRKAKSTEVFGKRKNKSALARQKVVEAKEHASRYPLQQHNVASLIMEMEPRLAAFGELLKSIQREFFQEYISNPVDEMFWGASRWLEDSVRRPSVGEKIDTPDLQCFLRVNEKGELEADFVAAYVNDLCVLRDENGQKLIDENGQYRIDTEKAAIFQACFQTGAEKWLEEKGYFVLKEGDKFRVYPEEFGEKKNGTWVLKTDKVEEYYHLDDCTYDDKMETYTPKPNARSRTGESMYLEPAAFEKLKNDCSKGPTLGDFLTQFFDGIVQECQDENVSAHSAAPRI